MIRFDDINFTSISLSNIDIRELYIASLKILAFMDTLMVTFGRSLEAFFVIPDFYLNTLEESLANLTYLLLCRVVCCLIRYSSTKKISLMWAFLLYNTNYPQDKIRPHFSGRYRTTGLIHELVLSLTNWPP